MAPRDVVRDSGCRIELPCTTCTAWGTGLCGLLWASARLAIASVFAIVIPAVLLGPPQSAAQSPPAASGSAPLTDAEIERLVAPYAGAPPAALGVVFDASRYPADLGDAQAWLRQPEADRGPPKETWPPSVRRLAERAPQVVDHLTADIASTAALGAAYQNQPNQVWQAYGKATAQLQSAQEPPAEPQPPAAGTALAPQPDPTASAAPAPAPAPTTTVIVEPAPVVVQQAPVTTSSGDTTSAVLTGGAIGLFGGLALASLFDDDDHWHGGYPYPAPYGASYDDRRALQEDRQAAAGQRQQDRQAATADRQQQRQDAVGQSPRPEPSAGQRAEQRPAGAQSPNAGVDRRAAATGAQQPRQPAAPRAQQPAAQRPNAAPQRAAPMPQVIAPTPQRAAPAPQRAAPAPQRATPTPQRAAPQRSAGAEWGPTQGMSGGGRTARSGGGGGGRGRR